MASQLFTQYFLTDGIKTTQEWESFTETSLEIQRQIVRIYEDFRGHQHPVEAATEDDLIIPVLELLGWKDHLPQQGASRNQDIPDYLLFQDAQAKNRAISREKTEERYLDASAVLENKRFGLRLESRDPNDKVNTSSPHGQILRYLSVADTASEGNIRWGILTNGALWRLYDRKTSPRASAYFEADLGAMVESSEGMRLFQLLFRRDSFIPQGGATTSFLEAALADSRHYEERVTKDLSDILFEEVFPGLIQSLVKASGTDLGTARDTTLIFLYRMLFLLYAEDRGLLPVNDSKYEEYGLRKSVRDEIARRIETGSPFSAITSKYYDHLMALCQIVDRGETSIGIPPYNGGLFALETAPLLKNVRLNDEEIAPIIHKLSHVTTGGETRFVNYRDMSVQQLGSIYERLLEREPALDQDGSITVRPNSYARKDSGSYFTPQSLVDLIVGRTLNPLIGERVEAFNNKARELATGTLTEVEQLTEMAKLDPAEAVLNLKVLDPAMGSGHFLVTAVDFLADRIAELADHIPGTPSSLSGKYTSPLLKRTADIRESIVQRAKESGWAVKEEDLNDETIIRRMVLKRCIYGVDKNPLTVELAKVSLWLHSFTVGAPLSFLNHHLRCGDALVGLKVTEATKELNRLGGLFASPAIAGAEAATNNMQRIEEMSDADISEVQESASLFQDVEDKTDSLRKLLDVLNGIQWQTAGMKVIERKAFESPLVSALEQQPAQAYDLLATGPDEQTLERLDAENPIWPALRQLLSEARTIADRETVLHWEVAFPGVWQGWQEADPQGGFDAVIGNPPWDRIKLQEVEWFATRYPPLALAPTAAARKEGIQHLRHTQPTLAGEYDEAKERADKLGHLVRSSGHYPLLSGGDVNLYSLFIERAMSLVKPRGMVGLLTPSGIYADKTAADFFKSISTAGRTVGLFDFENRKIFFKDIHASFKFCVLIFGGEKRQFPETECAFFLHDTATINDPERCFPLSPDDFARVNPNTGTAPIFRTRRDADITRSIYQRHPVLVDRSQGDERRAWPVRYHTMFHMTNDSHLFRTSAQLKAEGFYPVEGNRWKKGDEIYVSLYEGKMVQAFDHRAASVIVNPANLNRPAMPHEASYEEHIDPSWLPAPQFWVNAGSFEWPEELGWILSFKDVTAPTNARTMIAALIPAQAYGNTLPTLMPNITEITSYKETTWMLAACFNSLPFDFVARQKVQGQHLNWYIVEQLPVIAPDDYDRQFGATTARELVRDHMLRLTYTAHDMAPFARDLGYDGQPFIWNGEERRHLRARLDALYFHLYGISNEEAEYILETFPIVKREDEAEFGTYRTKELILSYMNALAAGDTVTVVAG